MKRSVPIFKPVTFWAPDAPSAPTPTPDKPKKVYAAIAKTITESIQETRDVIRTARRPEYASILQDEQDVTPAEVDALETANENAARLFGLSYDTRKTGQSDTADKTVAETALIAAMRRVQSGAKRTFGTRAEMERYYVSKRLEANETVLSQYARDMLTLLQTETLKGVKAPQIAELQNGLDAWVAAGGDQSDSDSDALTDRKKAEARFHEAEAARRDIQIAADSQWPYTDAENYGAREAFQIPQNRPYVYVPHD